MATPKKPVLTPLEKSALKYVKTLYKTGNPGDLQKILDSMGSGTKATIASAIEKTKTTKQTTKVNTPAKQAKPDAIKVRNKSTGKLVTLDTKSTPRGGRGGGGGRGGAGGFGGGAGLRGNVNK
jgi:hypothetical protein